ncbi:hypothetical protein Bca101_009817 [Brassica carinata]
MKLRISFKSISSWAFFVYYVMALMFFSESGPDVYGGNSNNSFSTEKKLGYNNNSGYYGGYYPQAYQYYPRYELNAAYNEAAGDKSSCPVFLIFSVNTSGQFVGLAEMVGPVDFNRRWITGSRTSGLVASLLSGTSLKIHITLENNENKPDTNSRDTQEVKIEQGVKVIKIFKEHVSKTCILDDFVFYESSEKIIKEEKNKHQLYKKQQFFTASDKKATPNDESKETSVIAEVAEEISQKGVAEVASAC